MTQTLPEVAHEHHARLLVHVDRMPAMADALLGGDAADAQGQVAQMRAFLAGTLLPHMDAAERTLYPELERILQNRHSMQPMRHEHEEVRKLVAAFEELSVPETAFTIRRNFALRRVTFQLFAMLKVHLGEEEAYLRVLDRGTGDEMREVLAAALEHPVAG